MLHSNVRAKAVALLVSSTAAVAAGVPTALLSKDATMQLSALGQRATDAASLRIQAESLLGSGIAVLETSDEIEAALASLDAVEAAVGVLPAQLLGSALEALACEGECQAALAALHDKCVYMA